MAPEAGLSGTITSSSSPLGICIHCAAMPSLICRNTLTKRSRLGSFDTPISSAWKRQWMDMLPRLSDMADSPFVHLGGSRFWVGDGWVGCDQRGSPQVAGTL